MIVKNIHSRNAEFNHNGAFGINVPLIEPAVHINAWVSSKTEPVTLHTMIRIQGEYYGSEFSYTNEENIEIDLKDERLNIDKIVNEIENSANRCFEDAHRACIKNSLPFPFPYSLPKLDLIEIKENIQKTVT